MRCGSTPRFLAELAIAVVFLTTRVAFNLFEVDDPYLRSVTVGLLGVAAGFAVGSLINRRESRGR
ncbi:MAG: hypothetical protein M3N47_11730 [Chloroflexota bacterium]|nr:hypothetical protein [Chloroflexota bacterium]